MNSEMVGGKRETEKIPVLMISKHTNLVVLFSAEDEGIVVYGDKISRNWGIFSGLADG